MAEMIVCIKGGGEKLLSEDLTLSVCTVYFIPTGLTTGRGTLSDLGWEADWKLHNSNLDIVMQS